MKNLDRASDQDLGRLASLLRAGSHPMRLRVLARFEAGDRSPAEVARSLGTGLPAIGYHVHRLADAGLLREDGARPVRGAVEHFYSPTAEGKKLLSAIEKL
jgi:DNA-binding transcriptional ArsR family regulator